MPRLHAKHRTEIRYAGAVGESVNEIRLVPSDNGRQQVEWTHVRVQPGTELMSHRDAYGNEVRWFQLTEPHETLVVEAEAIVTTRPGNRAPAAGGDDGFEGIDDPAYRDRYAEFLAPSERIRWTEPVALFARALPLEEGDGLLAWACALEAEVNRAISYVPGVTRVDTPVS